MGHRLVIGEGDLLPVIYIINFADPHHFDPDPDPASTLMRIQIRILLVTLMRIRILILLVTLMRIQIRILLVTSMRVRIRILPFTLMRIQIWILPSLGCGFGSGS